ncbi:MAG: phosphotransferase [Woeseiaceae bacterium]|nr:phosphotransferase [Woeseiaceae bacterium]
MTKQHGALDSIAAAPPNLPKDAVLDLLQCEYGLYGELSVLVSERDQNFLLDTRSGERLVVKIANAGEPFEVTEFQVEALQRLERQQCAVAVPRVLPTTSGQAITSISAGDEQHSLRVVSFLPGRPLEGKLPGARVAFDMGRSLALIDRALDGFTHPGESQELLWDMQRAAEIRPLVRHVPGAELQSLVGACIDVFETRLAPAFADLRTQVIHNDLNPGNVLLTDGDPPGVAGVIDFGDMLRAPLIVDVAIAMSYLRAAEDELAVPAAFARGFDSESPLEYRERELLFDLIRMRLATTITILYWRASARSADDPYLRKALEERGAERFLRHLSQLGQERFLTAVFSQKNA